jgi:hypothetical protein
MNIRDLKPNIIKRLAVECEKEFGEWFRTNRGMKFGTQEPLEPIDIWRYAYSKGASAILKRVDKLKE